jgi:hypothetical protein
MKALKWIGIIVVVLGVTGYFGFDYMKEQTKKNSPQDTIVYKSGNFTLEATYCRPFKKGREIFGGLVPLGEVWRTGANEPTTLTTNKQIKFGNAHLPAGTYSLWTIPQQTQWTIILNSEIPDWGVTFGSKASRNPEFDVIKINSAVMDYPEVIEQFTMAFEYNVNLTFLWDQTKVSVPIEFSSFE